MDASLKRNMYLAFVFVGVVVPYSVFLPWLMVHGLDLQRFFREASASSGALCFLVNVIVGALVILWASAESVAGWRRWLIWAVTLLAGVSAGLPLLLYFQPQFAAPEKAAAA